MIIVPARGGSKRLPGKNLRCLAGKSLLAHTAEAIAGSGLNAPVVLSTDDDAIAEEGERLGWRVPFRRPANLSSDDAPTFDAILHALDWFRGEAGADPDAVMVLQPTSPLRGRECLDEAVRLLDRRPDADSIVAMSILKLPARYFFYVGADGLAARFSDDGRSPIYAPNGALYLTRVPALRAHNSLYAGAVLPLVLDAARSVDIDTHDDWFLAEAILAAAPLPEAEDFTPIPSGFAQGA